MNHPLLNERQKMDEFQMKVYAFIKKSPNCTVEDIYLEKQFKFLEKSVAKAVTFLMLNGWIRRNDSNSALMVREWDMSENKYQCLSCGVSIKQGELKRHAIFRTLCCPNCESENIVVIKEKEESEVEDE